MSGQDWVAGINRLKLPPNLPVTLQGGEPSVHKDFLYIINNIRPDIPIDILTNLEQPLEFWSSLDPARLRREALYASIRVSWHKGQHPIEKLLIKVARLQEKGFSIGIWTVDHPDYRDEVREVQRVAWSLGLDFRLKEFLGPWKGTDYGTYRYGGAVNSSELRSCECRTTELLIAPDGNIYRCHSDLYSGRLPIGHIHNPANPLVGQWVPCAVYGKCNSCDIKLKTDRFQQSGHSSVEIRSITKPYAQNAKIEEVENTYGKQ